MADGEGGVFRACHTLDVTLLFGTFDAELGPVLLGPAPPSEATALGDHICAAGTDCTATGDPGWPAYDPERRLTQVFDVDPVVTAYPEETSLRL